MKARNSVSKNLSGRGRDAASVPTAVRLFGEEKLDRRNGDLEAKAPVLHLEGDDHVALIPTAREARGSVLFQERLDLGARALDGHGGLLGVRHEAAVLHLGVYVNHRLTG
jgi:hypothetical protein